MSATPFVFSFLILQLLFASQPCHRFLAAAADGRWQLLQKSIGVSAMHMQLLRNDRVVVFDRTDFGPSKLPLPNGKCRNDPSDTALKVDCTAHSVEYDVLTNTFRPLMVQTDVWCSSGAIMPNGNLVQTGGFNDGERRVRTFSPCSTCDWQETPNGLAAKRWYASNHILPDGRQIVVGGRRQFNYEFVPKTITANTFSLPFLSQTSSGTAGWELGRNPVLNPVLYKPDNKIGTRFETQNPTTVPRLYHSTAALLRDGRVLLGGSNPHAFYNLTGVLFPTELSLEAFSPAYLDTKFNNIRPTITAPKSMSGIKYGTKLTVRVVITGKVAKNQVSVTMVAPAFNTHSFSMNQRLLVLGNDKVAALGKATYDIDVTTPRSGSLAPSGFYLLFVVHQGIPSKGIWVKLQ
ncbi:aldehyde oxidase GLOX-like [Gossypium australe]|uniref:Aldehyde oxidase GLOX-like n=1 Tax=Gossypium australe TaxID=47621 RepID=A0A5B6UIX5_9ROSI|nr:aldehyde oxidase GLOX-like [Gossypium australe]